MKSSARTQRGITLVGFIIVLVIAGFFGYMGMILGPAYSEYYSVVKAMNTVAADSTPGDADMTKIRKALDRQFNVDYVDSVDGSKAKLVRDKSAGNMIVMEYTVEKHFLYNIFFHVKFAHTATLGSRTAGD
jgi:Tfp pilus assembly major pilin PilA